MSKTVIIGAGPAGLSFALLLAKKGIKDIIIFDPKPGEFSNPAPLDKHAFKKINKYLNEGSFFKKLYVPQAYEGGQLEEFEQGLYEQVQKNPSITVKTGIFTGFAKDKKGIIIQNNAGSNETLDADYVFDASGQDGVVLTAVNNALGEKHFRREYLLTHNIAPKHMMAKVWIDTSDLEQLQANMPSSVFEHPKFSTSVSRIAALTRLRKMGWERFIFPTFKVDHINTESNQDNPSKGKSCVCLSMEIPKSLTKDQQDEWIKLMMGIHIGKKLEDISQTIQVSYTHPSEQSSHSDETNVVQFTHQPIAIADPSYRGFKGNDKLPMVIPIGDAASMSDYRLAHGIRDSLKLEKWLVDVIDVRHGAIKSIDLHEYFMQSTLRFQHHKIAVKNASLKERVIREQRFIPILQKEINQLVTLLKKDNKNAPEINQLQKVVNAYAAFLDVKNMLNQFDRQSRLFFNSHEWQKTQMNTCIKELLPKIELALRDLPHSFTYERKLAKNYQRKLQGFQVMLGLATAIPNEPDSSQQTVKITVV